MIFWQVFYNFLLIGFFAIGGGASSIPFLFDLSAKYGWFTAADLGNMIAAAESAPGALGVNLAVYAGFRAAGGGGAFLAALGVCLPSLIVIIPLVNLIRRFDCGAALRALLQTVQPVVAALILNAALQIGRIDITSAVPAAVFMFMLGFMFCFKMNTVFYIVLSGMFGALLEL